MKRNALKTRKTSQRGLARDPFYDFPELIQIARQTVERIRRDGKATYVVEELERLATEERCPDDLISAIRRGEYNRDPFVVNTWPRPWVDWYTTRRALIVDFWIEKARDADHHNERVRTGRLAVRKRTYSSEEIQKILKTAADYRAKNSKRQRRISVGEYAQHLARRKISVPGRTLLAEILKGLPPAKK